MAPPNRLRPHLNDLLQKNHELEHTVADLRHQHTQSAAKWADEQKNLAMGCDALMASFAKFRARLDTQPSDWVDSEGEQDHDMGAGGAENGETQRDKESENLHEMCRTLAAELKTRDEQLVESQRKFEATEEELCRVIESSRAQIEQLQATLASTGANTASDSSPGHAPNDTSGQADLASSGPESAREKTTSSDQEISRLKQLLQQWQKYGNDWKRDAQAARSRVSALELVEKELNARLAVAEKDSVLLEKERKEAQKVAIALTEQQVATEYQKSARQEAVKRANDLEAAIARLRAQISPEQLATFDATPNQATAQPDSTQRQTPRANADTDTRNEMIVLRIPLRVSVSPGDFCSWCNRSTKN
ncbi:hypothetical protein BDN67DRAFT_558806 [Paxillus ammoniavirescens]|nr:hypothetical protein BDN67DRAFT_558806 [Paxillus ammoniavirescens]